MSKTIKFYEDELKTKQVYPEIDPEGKYPGVTVIDLPQVIRV